MECKLYFFFKDYSFHFILIFLIDCGWGFWFVVLRWVFGVRVMLMELGACGAGCSGYFGVRALYVNITDLSNQ